MRRRRLIWMAVILFVAINSLLVYLDDGDKVARLSYIKDWSETFEDDLFETVETAGVLSTVEEKHVYFDSDKGSFREFLAEAGSVVNPGDQLFSYEVDHYATTKAELESEQQRLTSDIQAIEAAVASIAAHPIPETDMDTTLEGDNSVLEITARSVDANYMKEQYMTEKEKERAQKEAELQTIQAQLSDLESTGETITVESPYQGVVTTVSESLANPVITIRDLKLQAEGDLTEEERMDVELDMPVEIAIRKNDTVLQGTVNELSDQPDTVTVHGTSVYPFAATFTEEMESSAPAVEDGGEAASRATQDGEEAAESTERIGESAEEAEGSADTAGETGGPSSDDADPVEESDTPAETAEAEQSPLDDLLPGYHADLSITTEESLGTTAVMSEQLFGSHLWKMTSKGLLVKQPVEKGIHMDELVEITGDVSPGELIAEADNDQFRDQSVFITPLQLDDIEWKHPGKYDNVDWKRYMVIGLLSR
ncbi:hypothetical protein [Lentibacillus salinarum]|uniref:HlyD family secretion protein n=1 Tax=Lentibacillus salinarum TaxID=446820 RepID=A0ABW3ZYR3_9BACI